MRKFLLSILSFLLAIMGAQAKMASDAFDVTYALQEGETHASGETVSVKANGQEVATITFGEEGGSEFQAGSADSHVAGFVAYTPGNGVNGNKEGGTFYTIKPNYNGKISVAVVLNASKSFYILKDGTALPSFDGIQTDEKYYGTFDFDVKGGSTYKIYCAGSKLGFYGFNYTGTQDQNQQAGDYKLYIGVQQLNASNFIANFNNGIVHESFSSSTAPWSESSPLTYTFPEDTFDTYYIIYPASWGRLHVKSGDLGESIYLDETGFTVNNIQYNVNYMRFVGSTYKFWFTSAPIIYIETDLTDQFSSLTNWTKWIGATGYTATQYAPMVTTNSGQSVQMCERYDTNCDLTGDVFYQNLSGLTPGIYKIELYGAAAFTFGRGFESGAFVSDDREEGPLTQNTGLALYAETSNGTVPQEIPAWKATAFSEVSTAVLDGVEVGEDGNLKLGMSKSSNYTNWHIVQLKGVTAKVNAAELYTTYMAQANAIVGEPMNATVLAQLQAAMVDDSGFTTAEEYEAAINALSSAITAANASVNVYKNVKNALDEYAAKAEKLDESGKAAYNVAAIQKAYDDRTLENDNVVSDIKAAYIAAVKAQTTPGSDFTDAGSKDRNDWIGSTGNYATDYAERFGQEMPADTIMHQTISGLPAGTYKVELYAVASQAWNAAAIGNDITVAYANDGIYPLEVIAQVSCDPSQSVATIEANVDFDGLLDMGMRNIANGGNWFVIQLKSITLLSLKPEIGEAIALNIESGKDITTEVATALESNPNPESITINLAAGGQYTVSGTIETAAPLTIVGGGKKNLATIDASALTAPMTAIRTTPYKSTLEDNNFYKIGDISFSNIKVKGLTQQLIYGNKVRSFIPKLNIENSIIEVAGGSKTVIDFNGGGVVGELNVSKSTIYGNPQHTGQFYSSQSGQKVTDYNADMIQTFRILNSTFYNIAYGKNVNTHRQSNQKWLSYELKNSLILDCGKDGQFVKGLNGGQGGANPIWDISGNSFQRIVEGAITDISANEETGDEAEPVSNNVEGVTVFTGDYTIGDFSLGDCPQNDALIGDPRWHNIDNPIVLNLESGKDISAELAAALETTPVPTSITINLAAGGEFTVSNTLETCAPLTIAGDDESIATIDASALTAPMSAISTTLNENTLEDNNFYNIGEIIFSNIKVKGLTQQLIYGNKMRSFIPKLTIKNSIIEVAGGSKTVIDFNGGGVVGTLSVYESTIYANPQHTGQLYSSQGGQKATDYSSDLIQTFRLYNSTFYNIAYGKNVNTHRQSNQKWLSYDVSSCLVLDCGKEGQFIKGLNGGQGGSNPIWNIEGNSFLRTVDGIITDISDKEETGDTDEPVTNNIHGAAVFTGDITAGDFTLGICPQDITMVGDPRWFSGNNYYEFVASEWIAGDPGRISPDNVSVDEEMNTITVSQTGTNNVNLLFRSTNEYIVPEQGRYFVVIGTGLSTNDGDSYLWWLNNTNDGGQYKPSAIYEEDGETVFAWDVSLLPIGGDLGKANAIFKDEGGWSTTFGMTLADANTPAVISYIGFTNEIVTPTNEAEYAWDATLWVAGDPGRISPDKVSVDEVANTITVSQTGVNNMTLVYRTDKVLYVTNAKYFVIQGKGLSTADTMSYLWWLNNTNNGTQVKPNIAVENAEGVATFVWTIAETGLGASFEQEKTYLVGGDGWNTTFGLTLSDDATPAVISYIGYEKDGSEIVKEAQDLYDGISGIRYNDAENGTIYNLNGQKVNNPSRGIYIINGKKVVVK